jgi:hypothetical protein
MKLKTVSTRALLLVLSAHLAPASAVCFYPGSDKSGYKLPLETEVRTAEAIVIGRVLAERQLQEDAADPDGVTASNVTIEVLKKLKGNPPSVIGVRNENTSCSFPVRSVKRGSIAVEIQRRCRTAIASSRKSGPSCGH